VGINVGVAQPFAFYPFSGWRASFYGDLHFQGTFVRNAVDVDATEVKFAEVHCCARFAVGPFHALTVPLQAIANDVAGRHKAKRVRAFRFEKI
jgi:hypothetical protein